MIERGSGRTSGLTDWHLMDVLSMWACVQDQDTTGQWKQVAGWRKICDLALAHLSRLREYRRGLADAWPPETNAAARTYLAELDQLIDKVQRTHDAAVANYDALAAATRAIASTRADLKLLHDEYAAKFQQKQAYEEIVADPKAVAGSRLPTTPPVTDADLEGLNVRARGLMVGLSGELQQAQAMLRQPPPAQRPGIETNNPDAYGSAQAPIIPPVVPVAVAASPMQLTPHEFSTTKSPAIVPTAAGPGPVLGGTGPALTLPPVTAAPSITPTVPPTSSTIPTGNMPPLVPPIAAPGQDRKVKPISERLGPTNKSLTGGPPHAAPPRPMQPGGLIGGTPGMGLGQPGARAIPSHRVNPVGGIIGGGGAGTAPSGAAGSRPGVGRGHLAGLHGVPPYGGSPSVGSARQGGDNASNARDDRRGKPARQWDPDNPWETDKGVAPIVRPPDNEGPIDPGPAIGLDR
ncbi:hypothetical protein [Micromonospora sp. NPDC005806]|uniref:hypothetical protein n=1 Tax=Micromonospora sp. NPDC005806 TaxID=3364234 RepID=UPI0036B10B55